MRVLSKVNLAAVALGAAFAIAVTAMVFGVPSFAELPAFTELDFVDVMTASPVLIALRKDLAALERRAKDKMAEITDGTSDERAREIEEEHKGILAEIEDVRSKISEAEAEAAAARSAPGGDQAAIETVREEATAAERARIDNIRQAVRDFGFEEAEADAFIRDGQTIDQVREALQRQFAEQSNENLPGRTPVRATASGRDERESRIERMGNALAHRVSPGDIELDDGAREYRGMTLIDMARDCLEGEGVNTRGLTRLEMATLALAAGSSQLGLRAGMHTTSDFPIILGNEVNRRLRAAYDKAPRTYRRIARRGTATDFRPLIRAQIGDAPRLLKLNEHGEYQQGTIGEASEQFQLDTFGRIVAITRQTLVNDDLDALSLLPRAWGAAAGALENEIVWGIITTNAALTDTIALFHANHGNLAGSGGAIAVATIGAARTAMRKQTSLAPGGKRDEKGYNLRVEAVTLCVPAALETVALQFTSQNMVPVEQDKINPYSRSLTPVIEPLLDEASATAWYLAADPDAIDTIEYAYLDGQDGVYTESQMGFEVDGVRFKARLDFGAGALDYRGLYKNPGA